MNRYDPGIHHRRSIRLKGYAYAQAGLYFVTICFQDRMCPFGHIEKGKMVLNEYGEIGHNEWMKLSERFPNIELDVFQIMPNHMHGIISVGAGFTPAPNAHRSDQKGQPQGIAPTVSAIIHYNGQMINFTDHDQEFTTEISPTIRTGRVHPCPE